MKVLLILFFVLTSSVYAETRPETLKARAVSLFEKGRFNEARTILEDLKTRDQSKDIFFLLGFAYLKTGKYSESVDSFRTYEKATPENDEYHYYIGVSLYELKRYDEALDEFNKAILAGVKVDASSYYSGYVHFIRDDCNGALPFFVNVSKEAENDYTNLAHYYAGVCLYRDGINDPRSLDSAEYHFKKVLDDKGSISREARTYIDAIDEYQKSGVLRYKNRYNVGSILNILYSSNRTINPIEGIPTLGIDTGKRGFVGQAFLNLGISPIMYQNFAVFLDYRFKTDLAFSSDISNSDFQGHQLGLNFQFYDETRTFEGLVGYHYEYDLVDTTSFQKITSAHVIDLGVDKSLTSTWAMGLKAPFRLYNGNGGAWGSFTGKSMEFILYSYHIFGRTSLRFEPSVLLYMSSSGTIANFQHYRFAAKANLPWKILFLTPSLRVAPGRLTGGPSGTVSTYDFGVTLFRPIGLGMRLNLSSSARKGFVSNNWEMLTGVGIEYYYQ